MTGAVFVAQSRRHPSPVIHVELLRVRSFRWALVSMLAFNVSFAANLLVGILWQQVWGYSALTTGFAVAAGPVMVPVTAALAHRWLGRIQPGYLIAGGSLLCALGAVLLLGSMGPDPAYATAYLPGWLVAGVGVSLLFAIVGSRTGTDLRHGFVDVWWVSAGVLVLAAGTALGMTSQAASRPLGTTLP